MTNNKQNLIYVENQCILELSELNITNTVYVKEFINDILIVLSQNIPQTYRKIA